MHKLLTMTGALLILLMMGASTQANASEERWPRWYVGLSGGIAFLDDVDLEGGITGNQEFDIGGMGTLALGYMPPATMQPFSNMRFEAELGYHYHHLDDAVVSGTPTATNGHFQSMSYMGNVYYDFANGTGIKPYVGAGAGGATVMLSRSSGLGNTGRRDTVFAYQFMGGLSFAPTSLPQTEWSLGYRYFMLHNPEFSSATGPIEFDNPGSHNVELGAKFIF